MSDQAPTSPGYIIPGMSYDDAPAAIDWLTMAFGFTRQLVVPGENGTIAHAQLSLGNGMIMLGHLPTGKAVTLSKAPPKPEGIPGACTWLSTRSTPITNTPKLPGPKSSLKSKTNLTAGDSTARAIPKATSGTSAPTTPGKRNPPTVDMLSARLLDYQPDWPG